MLDCQLCVFSKIPRPQQKWRAYEKVRRFGRLGTRRSSVSEGMFPVIRLLGANLKVRIYWVLSEVMPDMKPLI